MDILKKFSIFKGKKVKKEPENLLAPECVTDRPEQGLAAFACGRLQRLTKVHTQHVIIIHSANQFPAVRQLPVFMV